MRLALSIAAALTVLVVALDDMVVGEGTIFMSRPLSFKHKSMERECVKCHEPWRGVRSESCKACHKKEIHIKDATKGQERDCLECHREHKGEQASLTVVLDSKCLQCHNKDGNMSWTHKKGKPARGGVLLTHKVHFDRGLCLENLCRVCHTPDTFRWKGDNNRPVKDIMYRHTVEMRLQCMDCHDEVKTEGFSASGGGVNPNKCANCHRKRFVSVSCGYCHQFHHVAANEIVTAAGH